MIPILRKAIEQLNGRIDLTCMDFHHTVEILHGDYSHFVFQNAKLEEVDIDGVPFIFVWTEHCGYHAFFKEDLEWWHTYEPVYKPIPEGFLNGGNPNDFKRSKAKNNSRSH